MQLFISTLPPTQINFHLAIYLLQNMYYELYSRTFKKQLGSACSEIVHRVLP